MNNQSVKQSAWKCFLCGGQKCTTISVLLKNGYRCSIVSFAFFVCNIKYLRATDCILCFNIFCLSQIFHFYYSLKYIFSFHFYYNAFFLVLFVVLFCSIFIHFSIYQYIVHKYVKYSIKYE